MAAVKIYDFSHEDFEKHIKACTLSADYMLNLKLVAEPNFVPKIRDKIKTYASSPDDILARGFSEYDHTVVGEHGKIAAEIIFTPLPPQKEEARLGLALLLEADQPDPDEGLDYLSNFISSKLPADKVHFSRGLLWAATSGKTPVGPKMVRVSRANMYRFARYTLNPMTNQWMDSEVGDNAKQKDARQRFDRKLRRYTDVYDALYAFDHTDKANVDARMKIVAEILNNDKLPQYQKLAREALLFILEAKCIGQPKHEKILALVREHIDRTSYSHSDDPEAQRQWKLRKKALRRLKRRVFLRKNIDRALKIGVAVGGAALFMKGYKTPDSPGLTVAWQSLWVAGSSFAVYYTSIRNTFGQIVTYDRRLNNLWNLAKNITFGAAVAAASILGGELLNEAYMVKTEGLNPTAAAKFNNPFSRASDEIGKKIKSLTGNPVVQTPTPATTATPALKLVSGAVSGSVTPPAQAGGVAQPAFTGIVVAIQHTPLLKDSNGKASVAGVVPAVPCTRLMVTGDAGEGYWSVRVKGVDGYKVRSSHVAKGRAPTGTEQCGRPGFAYSYDDSLLSDADAARVISLPNGQKVNIDAAPRRELGAGLPSRQKPAELRR